MAILIPALIAAGIAAAAGLGTAGLVTGKKQVDKNNALAQANAAKAMEFEKQQSEAAMAHEAQQAQAQMKFQEYMSNTAHQRQIADLKAAGLNPVLSANSGAAAMGGAMGSGFAAHGQNAQVDTNNYGFEMARLAHSALGVAKARAGASTINKFYVR